MQHNEVQTPTATVVTTKKPSCFQGLQLFIVQSSVCILAIVIVLLLRVIGSGVFTDLAAYFQNAMLDESLLSVVSDTFEETVNARELSSQSVMVSSLTEDISVCAPLTGGVVTSAYGGREDPFDSSQTSTHQGVDIAAAQGTPLAAFMDGTVVDVGYEENGYGHYLLVECDDDTSYLYAHCSQVIVSSGMCINAGETIAYVGSTGRSTGNHLHFEWRENGAPVDPMAVLPSETYA